MATDHQRARRRIPFRMLAVAAAALAAGAAVAADHASGSIALGKHAGTITHATLVRGPDEMDPSKSVLRLYLGAADLTSKIKACQTLDCADEALGEGAAVDFADASHLGYFVRLNGGLVQYSGGTTPSAFALSAKGPDRLAGKLAIDDASAGGAKIAADFDVAVSNTFQRVH